MYIFFSLGLAGFLYLMAAFIFGHDHDGDDHSFDQDHDHDGDDHSGNEATVSIFSGKVIATFIMVFGGAGGTFRFYDYSYPVCALGGVGSGILVGLIMWGLLVLIYKQQASSNIKTSTAIGRTAIVTIGIDTNAPGEVGVDMDNGYMNYIARSINNKPIAKGSEVKIVSTSGSSVFVQ
ncbi:MAG: hypothetical protein COX77_02590 [Candidatus Komeilibacteria bacterium CG_4_10_14_0_2_um_filter_37_10]|uniref:NfeD-like C-terminal domain-containing protein n=1 Tax=Candidatus Komeilibacteria bacterium CG_4_10_14_0_2_um_filter_37_10 TaxID=1974470 RepID=A0A2M7VET6_9BACT|nr:MAG: hypothetical protein COX77_02590 [Candidatus Komeilibacteria bacterium CG_4_10_14_0_2_um_filter_37_10]